MQGVQAMILPDGVGYDGATLVPIVTDLETRLIPARHPTPVSIVELGKKLLIAAKNGDCEEVRELMAKGAPFTTDWLGTSPLHFAALHNHLETCEVLLRAGISRDARTKVDRTPLHMAAYEGHADIVESLILNGADVDAKDMLKMTPLHWAVQNEYTSIVVLLLRHGANPDIVNKFEKTPADIAVDLNRMDILQQLQCITKDPIVMNHDLSIELSPAEETKIAIGKIHPHIVEEDNQPEEMSMSPPDETNLHAEYNYTTLNNIVNNSKHIEHSMEEHETMDMESIEILKEHGISFLSNDESSVVASAVENGHSLVLTEVGKQVLNSTKPYVKIPVQKAPIPAKLKGRKVVTVTTEQLLAMVGQKNGIFKKLPSGLVSLSEKPIKRSIVMNKNKIIVGGLNAPIKKKSEFNVQPDIDSIRRQLAEARQQAEEYKQMLKRKEAEAERYKRQLQSITQGK